MNDELLEIRQAFAIEGAELLAQMESALLLLESGPDDMEEVNRLFRAVHTLKGSAGIVGSARIEQFCHVLEHLLVRIREQAFRLATPVVSLFLQCHDHLNSLVNDFFAHGEEGYEPPPRHKVLLDLVRGWESVAAAEAAGIHGAPCLSAPESDASYGPGNRNDDSDLLTGFDSGGFDCFDSATPGSLALQDANRGAGGIDLNLSTVFPASEPGMAEQKVVRVDTGKLDQLIDLVVELVTATSVMEANVRRLKDSAAGEAALNVSSLVKDIQEKTMSFRMVPVNNLFRRFQRIVYDIGSESGKNIALAISGGETELEKVVAEKLREPLLHLVRNSIDHGIEPPDERLAKGKAPQGTIRLNAFQDAGNVVIEVGDDGRGLDRARIMNKAIALGVGRAAADCSDRELLDIICAPGFSTLDNTTMLSGRGVGMDSVKMSVESLRGRIELESAEGRGTTVRIRIPLTLTVIDGFMVMVGATHYLIPMELIVETLEMSADDLRAVECRGYIDLRDSPLPCIALRPLFGIHQAAPPRQFVVVVKNGEQRVGFVADRLMGELKAVIKPLGRIYRSVSYVSGAAILADGAIALLLEADMLVEGVLEKRCGG